MTDEPQKPKAPDEGGQDAAQVVGDRDEQVTEGRFSKESEGGAVEQTDDERQADLPDPQEQTEATVGEGTVDDSKEDLQDAQKKANAKFGEAQGKLPGRPLQAAAIAAIAGALLLLLFRRRRG